MTELKILRKCFAYTAFVFAFVSIAMLPALTRAPFPHATSHFHAEPLGILLIVMREMILFLPPVLAVVNGIAWWAVKNTRPSARRWAMTASYLFLAFSVPFFVADVVILQYALVSTAGGIGVFLSSLIFSGIGITGLAFFSRCEALGASAVALSRI
jgi:hypothetical protein